MYNRTVSVVMCTCNGGKYLTEQLDSILEQTYAASEILVQDDCSTDDTRNILSRYATLYPQIRVIYNQTRRGINANFYSAMRQSKGDFIALSDQDDIWLPDKLERQMEAIGDCLLCGGLESHFSTTGVPCVSDLRPLNCSLLRAIFCACVGGHTMLFPRRLLDKIPNTPFVQRKTYDVILTITAAVHDSLVFLNEELVRQRRHAEAATYTPPVDNSKNLCNVVHTTLQSIRLYSELREELMRQAALVRDFLRNYPPPNHLCLPMRLN